MFRRSMFAWVVNACSLLRPSQSRTLAQIVFGAMGCRRVSQADIGRAMETGTTPKHNIKRVSRFVGNKRVNVAKGCRGLAADAREGVRRLRRGRGGLAGTPGRSGNIRYGWGLRQMKISTAARLERIFLVLAFAYLLLLMMGLVCRETMSEAHWASAATKTKDQACGFTIGRYMLTRVKWRLATILEALERMLTGWVEEKWG